MGSKIQQTVLFEGLFKKPVHVEFMQPDQSSDGGVILLKAEDEKIRLTERMASVIHDGRQAGKIRHEIREMLQERIFGIACGYPDGNDARHLAIDPMMKMVCDQNRSPEGELASQPTISRFENAMSRTDLLRMAYAMSDVVLEAVKHQYRRKKVKRIVIDMDPTEDPTYGDQQQTFFNAYYDNWCYLPMITTIQINGKGEQYMVAPVLRPGSAKGSLGAISILQRIVAGIRVTFPHAKVYVRMDGAFATPEVLDWLEGEKLKYAVNMAKNSVLKGFAAPLMKKVLREARKSHHTEKEFGEAKYQAGKWEKERRCIIKAEVVACEGRPLRDNPRFVITNLEQSPQWIYGFYTDRGDMENRIKELHHGLRFDLTSCQTFEANQFRNLLTAAAYVLYQQLRQTASRTPFANAQVSTLRERLIKIGVTVHESLRRIVLRGPLSYPEVLSFRRIAAGYT